MASIPCCFQLTLSSRPDNSSSSSRSIPPALSKLTSQFVAIPRSNRLGWCRPASFGRSSGSRTTCWLRIGKKGADAEGSSQTRDYFNRDDVEQYFNYMGMLAVEGTYDRLEALLSQNIHPIDILLMLAASEGDKPKIEELLRAGADYSVKDAEGLTAVDKAANDEIKEFILGFSVPKA